MTAERWLARRIVAAYLGTAVVLFLLVAGIDGIERSRLLTGGGQGGPPLSQDHGSVALRAQDRPPLDGP